MYKYYVWMLTWGEKHHSSRQIQNASNWSEKGKRHTTINVNMRWTTPLFPTNSKCFSLIRKRYKTHYYSNTWERIFKMLFYCYLIHALPSKATKISCKSFNKLEHTTSFIVVRLGFSPKWKYIYFVRENPLPHLPRSIMGLWRFTFEK